jgi:transcriptional regulator with GAF, ATPase, and Fis domain
MDFSQMLDSRDRGSSMRGFEQIIGNSPALERALHQVKHVAPTDTTVLIEGETGTDKELIA